MSLDVVVVIVIFVLFCIGSFILIKKSNDEMKKDNQS